MDVGAWLRGLGLGQYEQAFRDNDVDADVLPELTADDLSELGVASVGHRASCSPPSPPCGPRRPPPPAAGGRAGARARRRRRRRDRRPSGGSSR